MASSDCFDLLLNGQYWYRLFNPIHRDGYSLYVRWCYDYIGDRSATGPGEFVRPSVRLKGHKGGGAEAGSRALASPMAFGAGGRADGRT